MRALVVVTFAAACVLTTVRFPAAADSASAPGSLPPSLRAVVIVTRHGVRSPTDPTELAAYVVHPWPAWEVAPGYLTPHGATLMTSFGAAYRAYYAAKGLLPPQGCPQSGSVWVWADVDQRTKATGTALLDGFAPHCGLRERDAGGPSDDPLFHPVPAIAKADAALSNASISGALGGDPAAIVPANGPAFAKLDALLGCDGSACRRSSAEPTTLKTSPNTGLTSVGGAVNLASTAVEDLILAYTDGKPMDGFGAATLDAGALLQLSALHTLKSDLTTQTPYTSRAQGSNLLAHVVATIDQAASGSRNGKTRAPMSARFIAFVGHDTNLSALAGLLRLHWLMAGYQSDDTPPGGALVFEVYAPAGTHEAFVRTYFTAQSLDEMRTLSSAAPARVPVFVPGCPDFDCPIATFDRITGAAIDPSFVGDW